ncbi:MAG: polysaccharide export protein [Bryobacteraceae bacterium]|nr:polysaccharide export protein [Bryobacteraceae bacterium]
MRGLAMAMAAGMLAAGAASAGEISLGEDGAPASFAERSPRYRIQSTDELEISFRFTPEFDQKLAVQPDGFISLLDVGDLEVAGMTVEGARSAIAGKYAAILNKPVITVKLTNFNKPQFIVGGEVGKPGKYELTGDVTLSDAVAIAGGFTPRARENEVLLFRRYSKEMVEVKKVNVKQAQHGKFGEDVRLRPGDSVFVPRSKVGEIDRFLSVTRLGLYFPLPGL